MFIWAALVGLITQFFINTEIERYTLATGETVLTGFSRYWRHWGLVFALLTYGANLWPAWATGSATLVTYLFDGGSANWIAAAMLVTVALILTLAPVVLRRAGAHPDAQDRRGAHPLRGCGDIRDRRVGMGGPAGRHHRGHRGAVGG